VYDNVLLSVTSKFLRDTFECEVDFEVLHILSAYLNKKLIGSVWILANKDERS
jgi:hypothetical protein